MQVVAALEGVDKDLILLAIPFGDLEGGLGS